MKLSVNIQVLLILLFYICCVCSTDVIVQSNPPANGSIIQTEKDNIVSLSCVVEGAPEGEELQWYRNQRLVSLKDGNRLDQSHLCVDPVTINDNDAIFTCQLKANASISASIQLEVNYAPDINGSEELQVSEESDIVLSCNIQAYPPASVIWKKDDDLLDLSSSNYITTNNGITTKLSIYNIKRDTHQGTYRCEATSSVYGVKSKSFILTVHDKVMAFPLGPTIAGVVVVLVTILLAVISRWKKVTKCFKRASHH